MPRPLFHIALHQPEIPNNTGNIGRTCIATGCALHLIRPLGFDTSAKACRRAGLDYWPRLRPTEHEDWAAFQRWLGAERAERPDAVDPTEGPRMWLFSTKGIRAPWEVAMRPGDCLVFGKETAGLPVSLIEASPESILAFPMVPGERSLNVATAVCAAVYEGIRQCFARGDDIGW